MPTTSTLCRAPSTGTTARDGTIAALQHAVAYFFGMRVEELHLNRTARTITVPRHIAMYLIKQMTDASLLEAGCFFGKHPSTAMHAIAKIEDGGDTMSDSI